MTENEKLAELLLPNITKTPEDYEVLYPPRQLKEGAAVTRIAPSPTGYLHLGTLFMALINRITADSTGGVMYTRIEDTDKKREIADGIRDIVGGLESFGVNITEGYTANGQQGLYGPYRQSERAEIYQCYVKRLLQQGLAYPCFCTADELETVRTEQEAQKIRTGYHGQWAKCRNLPLEQVEQLVRAGRPYVIRLRSGGSEEKKEIFTDLIKGKIEMPQNDEDFVLLKSDKIPTYHFAHAVDDHLMRTTHVIRGDEWISSVPKHLELFRVLGFKAPKYAHVAPIMKTENGNKRKISKRKDPEAAVRYFLEQGFEPQAVMEYLMTIASADFEQWRRANKSLPYRDFKFNIKKMSVSGALFDDAKLLDVSKNYISQMSSAAVTAAVTRWAEQFNPDYAALLKEDESYTRSIFAIDRDVPKPRKDLAKWSDAPEFTAYFFEQTYTPCYTLPEQIDPAAAAKILTAFAKMYHEGDDKNAWFEKVKSICEPLGFCSSTKDYKANPGAFKGHVGDVSTVLRIAVTGRTNTPDLCAIMQTLGRSRTLSRLQQAAEYYQKAQL